jgi:hypothetical protein
VPIVSSDYQDDVQHDGRRRITERHTDHVGRVYRRTYLIDAVANIAARLTAFAVQLDAQLSEEEFQANLQAILTRQYTLLRAQYATFAQHRARLRLYYRDEATRLDVALIALYFLTLTDAQLQTIFGVSAGAQTTALKARLQVRADIIPALDAATGE